MSLSPEELSDPRLRRLGVPHLAPLSRIVRELRALGRGPVPDFDPNDGGVRATLLLVMQRPGPKAVETGFISRENPDLTARYLGQLLAEAQIPRSTTVLWNIVPWYAPRLQPIPKTEISAGAAWLGRVVGQLPALKAVVFVGQKAQAAKPALSLPPGVTAFDSPHPSPTNLHTNPKDRDAILSVLREAWQMAGVAPKRTGAVVRACPSCGVGLRLPRGRTGDVRCPECGTRFATTT